MSKQERGNFKEELADLLEGKERRAGESTRFCRKKEWPLVFFQKAATAVKKQLSCIGRQGRDTSGGTCEMTGQTMYKLKDRHKSKEQMKRQKGGGMSESKGKERGSEGEIEKGKALTG